MKLVDLDTEEAVIVVTIAGKKRSYTRDELVEALAGGSHSPSAPQERLNQAQLGRVLAHIVAEARNHTRHTVRDRLTKALAAFDGNVSPHPSRIPANLARIVKLVPQTAGEVREFLARHKFHADERLPED